MLDCPQWRKITDTLGPRRMARNDHGRLRRMPLKKISRRRNALGPRTHAQFSDMTVNYSSVPARMIGYIYALQQKWFALARTIRSDFEISLQHCPTANIADKRWLHNDFSGSILVWSSAKMVTCSTSPLCASFRDNVKLNARTGFWASIWSDPRLPFTKCISMGGKKCLPIMLWKTRLNDETSTGPQRLFYHAKRV